MNNFGSKFLKFLYLLLEVMFSVFMVTFIPVFYGTIAVPLIFASMVSMSGLTITAGWEDKIILWLAPSTIISGMGACLLVIAITKAIKWSLVVYRNKLAKLAEKQAK
jgi:hypothetical protein